MISPNVLLHSAQPVVRRQVESALLSKMPNACLFEATDWTAVEALAEQHDLDIMLLSSSQEVPAEAETLAVLRRLQPAARMILLTLDPLPASLGPVLDKLDVSQVSLRYLAATLLRPVAAEPPGFAAGAALSALSAGRASVRPGDLPPHAGRW